MPDSVVAVALLVVLFLPGFLFQNGVKEYVSLLRPEREIQAVAQAVGLTAAGVVVVSFVLSFWPEATKQLLHNPTSDKGAGLNIWQASTLLFLLGFSNLIGKGVGKALSESRKARLAQPRPKRGINGKRKPVSNQGGRRTERAEPTGGRGKRRGRFWKILGWPLKPFFWPGPIDRRIDDVIKEANSADTYVRVIRQGQDDISGLMDKQAAEVSASPLGSGLNLTVRWTCDAEGVWRRGGPTHVSRSDIIEILTWRPDSDDDRPVWLPDIPPLAAQSSARTQWRGDLAHGAGTTTHEGRARTRATPRQAARCGQAPMDIPPRTRQNALVRLPRFLLQFSQTGYDAAVSSGLNKAFDQIEKVEELEIDSGPPIIIFSDLHKGARNGADDYWRCERAYRAALAYYYELKYQLYVLGDAEELWENRPDNVLAKHAPTLEAEALFHAQGRYIRFWGNHDVMWSDPAEVRSRLDPLFTSAGGRPLQVREAQKLRLTLGGKPLGLVFLVHGHQGTFTSDKASLISELFVRYIWSNVQRLTRIPSTTPATSWRLREKHDRAMAAWVNKRGATLGEPLVLIAGHTHRPVFGSELLKVIVEKELATERSRPDSDRRKVGDLSAKLAWFQAWRDWRDPHKVGQAPAYFNSGCCAFPDGDVTGLELADGEIRLIRWPEHAPTRKVLAQAKLADVFESVTAGSA